MQIDARQQIKAQKAEGVERQAVWDEQQDGPAFPFRAGACRCPFGACCMRAPNNQAWYMCGVRAFARFARSACIFASHYQRLRADEGEMADDEHDGRWTPLTAGEPRP